MLDLKIEPDGKVQVMGNVCGICGLPSLAGMLSNTCFFASHSCNRNQTEAGSTLSSQKCSVAPSTKYSHVHDQELQGSSPEYTRDQDIQNTPMDLSLFQPDPFQSRDVNIDYDDEHRQRIHTNHIEKEDRFYSEFELLKQRLRSRYDARLLHAYQTLMSSFIHEKCELTSAAAFFEKNEDEKEEKEVDTLSAAKGDTSNIRHVRTTRALNSPLFYLDGFCHALWDFAWNRIDTELLRAFEIRKVRAACNDAELIVVELEKHLPDYRRYGCHVLEPGMDKTKKESVMYGVHPLHE